MTAKKNRPPVIVTPKGVLAYPHLNTPDSKFDANKPKFKVTLLLPAKDPATQELMKKLDVAAAAAFAEKKAENPKAAKTMEMAQPYYEETDEEGNETGNIKFNISMNAQYQDKKTGKIVKLKPALRDAKKNELNPDKVKIGGGTEAKIALCPVPYYNASSKKAGVSLQLQGVQVIKLVEFGANGGNYFDEEDGYEATDDDEAPSAPKGDEGGDEGGEDDNEF